MTSDIVDITVVISGDSSQEKKEFVSLLAQKALLDRGFVDVKLAIDGSRNASLTDCVPSLLELLRRGGGTRLFGTPITVHAVKTTN